MKKYFDIHFTIVPGKESFSVPVEIEIDNDYDQKGVILTAIDSELIDVDDTPWIDNVRQIKRDEYLKMKGTKE